MISIYLLCLVIFPISALYGTKLVKENVPHAIMSKSDTMYLRGVAASFVVLAHLCIWVNELYSGMNHIFYVAVSQLGGIGVLIFFFVSGYGIYESYADKSAGWDYLWKRAKGVYFPYLVIKCLLLVLESIIEGKIVFDVNRFLAIILVEDWFIHVIVIQYLTFFVLWKFFSINRMILYSFLVNVVISFVFIMQNRSDRWFNALWLFTFGMACSCYEKQLCEYYAQRTWLKIIFAGVGFAVTGILFAVNKGAYWANMIKPISGMLLCLGLGGVFGKLKFTSKWMFYLGKRSMYIYIIHVNIWPMLRVENAIYRFWIVLLLSMILTEMMYRLIGALLGDPKK